MRLMDHQKSRFLMKRIAVLQMIFEEISQHDVMALVRMRLAPSMSMDGRRQAQNGALYPREEPAPR